MEAVLGYSCIFLPGILSYGLLCWLMPRYRLIRAFLIVITTCFFGIVGGFILEPFYASHAGPANDPTYHMAYIIGWIQLVVGFILGLVSLSPLSYWFKHDYEVLEKARRRQQGGGANKQPETNS